MTLNFQSFVIGSLQNNCYVVHEPGSNKAAIVDPGEGAEPVIAYLKKNTMALEKILITHAHFDHILGCKAVNEAFPFAAIFLHQDDAALWNNSGNAQLFGYIPVYLPQPTHWLQDSEVIPVGNDVLEARHTPGHTPGHVVYYSSTAGCVFCGDLIFRHSVGRTDLPGGDFAQLRDSIETKIYTLPDSTILLPGHGPATTVGAEKLYNPYV
ncbi:MAG TPA: MBL fold metallo-hydrolase [Anaerolineaceae bacterium]|nr:MBL fold metallo-hydrolase [Anaerolineaceae bacterium]